MTVDDLSEHELDTLEGLRAINAEYAADASRQLRDAGVPDDLAAAALAEYEAVMAARLERDWEMIRRDMKISAGEARLQ